MEANFKNEAPIGQRQTRQRDAILQVIAGAPGPLSVAEIHEQATEKLETLGIATVLPHAEAVAGKRANSAGHFADRRIAFRVGGSRSPRTLSVPQLHARLRRSRVFATQNAGRDFARRLRRRRPRTDLLWHLPRLHNVLNRALCTVRASLRNRKFLVLRNGRRRSGTNGRSAQFRQK